MQNPFLYPGRGKLMVVAGGTPDSDSFAEIDPTQSSETIGTADCLEIMFSIATDGPANGTIEVRNADTNEAFSTITVANKEFIQWNAGEALNFPICLYNNLDTGILELLCQKRIN